MLGSGPGLGLGPGLGFGPGPAPGPGPAGKVVGRRNVSSVSDWWKIIYFLVASVTSGQEAMSQCRKEIPAANASTNDSKHAGKAPDSTVPHKLVTFVITLCPPTDQGVTQLHWPH